MQTPSFQGQVTGPTVRIEYNVLKFLLNCFAVYRLVMIATARVLSYGRMSD